MVKKRELAVVIPYYKIDYFKETLISLKNQTNRNFNIYVGNDCSPSSPDQLILKYDSMITKYMFYDDNIGGKSLTSQWERCIDDLVEDEEWIMILCDDDLLDNNVVEEFYNLIDNSNVHSNVIKYATRIVSEDASSVLSEHKNRILENSINYVAEKILNRKRSTLSEHIFRKESYSKYRFKNFELAFGSDDVAWVDFTEGEDITCINNAFVNYRKSVLSISNNQDSKLKKRKIQGIIDSYTYILRNYNSKMNFYQKKVYSKRIYQYNRAIYNSDFRKQFNLILQIFRLLGVKETIKIIRNNKNYYEKPD